MIANISYNFATKVKCSYVTLFILENRPFCFVIARKAFPTNKRPGEIICTLLNKFEIRFTLRTFMLHIIYKNHIKQTMIKVNLHHKNNK